MELSKSEQHNLEWLKSVVCDKNYTKEFKDCAQRNIEKFERNL